MRSIETLNFYFSPQEKLYKINLLIFSHLREIFDYFAQHIVRNIQYISDLYGLEMIIPTCGIRYWG